MALKRRLGDVDWDASEADTTVAKRIAGLDLAEHNSEARPSLSGWAAAVPAAAAVDDGPDDYPGRGHDEEDPADWWRPAKARRLDSASTLHLHLASGDGGVAGFGQAAQPALQPVAPQSALHAEYAHVLHPGPQTAQPYRSSATEWAPVARSPDRAADRASGGAGQARLVSADPTGRAYGRVPGMALTSCRGCANCSDGGASSAAATAASQHAPQRVQLHPAAAAWAAAHARPHAAVLPLVETEEDPRPVLLSSGHAGHAGGHGPSPLPLLPDPLSGSVRSVTAAPWPGGGGGGAHDHHPTPANLSIIPYQPPHSVLSGSRFGSTAAASSSGSSSSGSSSGASGGGHGPGGDPIGVVRVGSAPVPPPSLGAADDMDMRGYSYSSAAAGGAGSGAGAGAGAGSGGGLSAAPLSGVGSDDMADAMDDNDTAAASTTAGGRGHMGGMERDSRSNSDGLEAEDFEHFV